MVLLAFIKAPLLLIKKNRWGVNEWSISIIRDKWDYQLSWKEGDTLLPLYFIAAWYVFHALCYRSLL